MKLKKEKIKKGIYFKFYAADFKRLEYLVKLSGECKTALIRKLLLNELIKSSEANGIWTIQAGILSENSASIELHKKCGFKILGVREKLGKLNSVWRDIVLMEKRSSVVGID